MSDMSATELREARKALGLSLSRFASLFTPPLAANNLSSMETGKRPISPGMAARVRAVLARARPDLRR